MKKLILLSIAIIFMSCSKDSLEDEAPLNDYWKFGYTTECGTPSTGSFCVTKAQYDLAMKNKYFINDICFQIRIKDVNGNSGMYIFSYGLSNCNR